MQIFVKNLCLLNLLSLALGSTALNAQATVDAAKYPTFTNVIFKIFYPAGKPTAVVDPQDPTWANNGVIASDIQVSVCRRFKINKCPVLPNMHSGTAFLVSNSFTVATALHNIHDWLFWVKKHNPEIDIRRISLPIYMLDDKGGPVLNTGRPDQDLKVSMINNAPGIFDRPYSDFISKSDRMALALSEYVELNSNVVLADRGIAIGPMDSSQKHVLVGFPGAHLQATSGTFEKEVPQFNLLSVTDIPLVSGFIGSPLYDTHGNVVAMMVATSCTGQQESCRSLFLRMDISKLRSVWNVLAQENPPRCTRCSRFSAGALKNAMTTKERLPTIQ